MKNFLFLVILINANVFAYAQEKICVGILPFTSTNKTEDDKSATSMGGEAVSNAFVRTKRFDIVDRTKMEAIKSEKELQKSEDFIDSKAIESGKSLGAQYLINGNINSCSVTKEDGKYFAIVAISLSVIDITTGQVVASETITKKAGGSLLGKATGGLENSDSAQEALVTAFKSLEGGIDKFVKTNFPVKNKLDKLTSAIETPEDEKLRVLLCAEAASGMGNWKGFLEKIEEHKIKIEEYYIKCKCGTFKTNNIMYYTVYKAGGFGVDFLEDFLTYLEKRQKETGDSTIIYRLLNYCYDPARKVTLLDEFRISGQKSDLKAIKLIRKYGAKAYKDLTDEEKAKGYYLIQDQVSGK